MWTEDVDDSEFIVHGLTAPQIAYIKEYDRSNMRDRIAIEFHSTQEGLDLMETLADMGYKPSTTVKVCGAGTCGQVRLFVK